MKGTDHFKRTIQMYLEQRAEEDTLFAKNYRNPAKNIDDCVTYILNYVQKSGCNGFTDGEIYGQAVHYYDENEIEVGKPIQCQVAVNHIVELTAEEKAEFEAFQREKAKKAAEEKAKNDREMYKQMVDEEIANSIPVLLGISEQIKASKQTVMDNFKTILEMKADLFKTKVKDDQRSHTFTNSEGDKRITLGVYVTDGYRDTVEDGIAIVKEYIEGLAKDEKTKALVSMVLRLLARDAKGTLKASRIVQLRKVAMETGDDRFIEGVRIIEEAYQPEVSKQFIRAEIKNENGMWKPIPLGMTES